MLLELFLVIFLGAFLAGAYFLYFKPKRTLLWYKKTLEQLGYNVKMLPFKFLGMPHIDCFFENEKKHLDPLYHYKNQLTGYDIVLYNIMNTPIIQLCDPELLKHLFLPDNVYVHYKMDVMIQNIQRSLGFGIAFSQGKQWKRKRLIMNAVFNYDFIIQNIEKISRICDENIKLFEEELKAKGKFEERDGKRIIKMGILQLFSSIFSNVMLQCFFGIESTHQRINGQTIATFLNKLNTDITLQGFQLPLLLFGPKFAELGLREKDRKINESIKILRGLAQDFVNKRLKQLEEKGPNENYKDIIEALMLKKNLSTQKKSQKDKISKKDAQNYDFAELIEEFCTFFTAGTDTTSHFTQMMIYYISKNPQVEKRLRSEIDLYIKSDKDITKQNLKKLTYIDWIQNQTTRMYGPGTGIFTRIAQKDHSILNIPIKKGMGINIQPTTFHYNEKYYKKAHQFRPQRWESECLGNHAFALNGFGGGPRSCIGKHLAMLQNKIALVKFMRRYKQYKLPKQNFAIHTKFLQEPEFMQIELVLND